MVVSFLVNDITTNTKTIPIAVLKQKNRSDSYQSGFLYFMGAF